MALAGDGQDHWLCLNPPRVQVGPWVGTGSAPVSSSFPGLRSLSIAQAPSSLKWYKGVLHSLRPGGREEHDHAELVHVHVAPYPFLCVYVCVCVCERERERGCLVDREKL